MENVKTIAPDFDDAIVTKQIADEIHQIENDAKVAIHNSTDDKEPQKIVQKVEKARKEVAKKTVITEPNKIIDAYKIDLSGTYLDKDHKGHEYVLEGGLVPRTKMLKSYLQQYVRMALEKEGKSVDYVLTYYIDDEEETTMPATFIGKNVLEFNKEEILQAKMYYGLRGINLEGGLREARVSAYEAVCNLTGREVPNENEVVLKKWPVIKLA